MTDRLEEIKQRRAGKSPIPGSFGKEDGVGQWIESPYGRLFICSDIWRDNFFVAWAANDIDYLLQLVEDQAQEIARHHKDFERWETMADKGAAQLEELEWLRNENRELKEQASQHEAAMQALFVAREAPGLTGVIAQIETIAYDAVVERDALRKQLEQSIEIPDFVEDEDGAR